MTLLYKRLGKTTTIIHADFQKKKVWMENLSDDYHETAFHKNEHPTWEDFEQLLERRCFPRTRDKMAIHLEALGLTEYDPLEIIRKTGGVMHGDNSSLEIETEDVERE